MQEKQENLAEQEQVSILKKQNQPFPIVLSKIITREMVVQFITMELGALVAHLLSTVLSIITEQIWIVVPFLMMDEEVE